MKALTLYTIVLSCFLALALFIASSPTVLTKAPANNYMDQDVRAIDINRPFSFAGEALPMDNFDVAQRLDKELHINAFLHASMILNIKRANSLFPTIEKILAEQGLPDDFKYLAVAESNLTNATSSAGAKGIWQFMKGTAQQMGLEVNDEIDERFHLEKSTEAACKFLKNLYKKHGSWSLVAAAYNQGGGRLTSDMEIQKMTNYYDLNFNLETSRYLFRIVSIKDIMENPEAYGFYVKKEQLYPPMDEYVNIAVEGPVPSWADFAINNGISYRMLKVYNPWILGAVLTNKAKKTYLVRVPKKG
jgi:hypothetical protein